MNKISYYIISHHALSALVKSILAIIANYDISTFGMQKLVDRVTVKNDEFTMARQRDMVNPLTAKLSEADELRNAAIVALNSFVRSCLYDPDERMREAANLVYDAIKTFGGDMYYMGYIDKTGAIHNLVTKLVIEPLNTAVQNMGAVNKVSNLKTIQATFDGLMNERDSEMETNDYTLIETRKKLIIVLRPLISFMDIQSQLLESDELIEMAAQVDNLIGTTMFSARISQGHKDNDKKEPTDETPTDETPDGEETVEEPCVCETPADNVANDDDTTDNQVPEVV